MATKLPRLFVPRLFYRNIILRRPLQDSLREPLAAHPTSHGAPGKPAASEMWKKIFLWACIPALSLCVINCLLHEEEEKPEFKPYEHLRIRRKRFPWGDGNKTLFHNQHKNALPNGYEE